MEMSLVEFFNSAPILVSLLAGILTFFSPCVLPLIPAYISYISGISIKELNSSDTITLAQKLQIVKSSSMFVLGFGSIFILLGVSMANLIGDIFNYPWVAWIAGGIVILFGLHIMGLFKINFLNLEKRASFGDTKSSTSIWGSFVLGVSFALGWTPCIGPIFTAIVSMAAQDSSKSISLMVVYTFGLGLPFILTGILTGSAFKFLNKIKPHFKKIEIVAGALLVLVGIAIATGGLGELSAKMMEIFG